MSTIHAPFTPEQVQALNEFQTGVPVDNPWAVGHPFTCPHRSDGGHGQEGGDLGVLVATQAGWRCPHCGHTQDWAHASMAQTPDLPADQTLVLPTSLMLGSIGARLAAYEALYQAEKLWPGAQHSREQHEQAEAARTVVEVMLRCLRRALMAVHGVETRPGRTRTVRGGWRQITQLPLPGQPIDVLMQDLRGEEVLEVNNPMHPGFGPSAWVREGGFFDPTLPPGALVLAMETGITTHWRPARAQLPASALPGRLMAPVPLTPQELREWLLGLPDVALEPSSIGNPLLDRYTLDAWTLIEVLRRRARWVGDA